MPPLLLGAEINAEIAHAAAERGARTAKARGEHVPGEHGRALGPGALDATLEVAAALAAWER